jgi:hypothetical protein
MNYYFPDQSSNQIKFIYNDADRLVRKDWYTIKNEVDYYENYIYQQGLLSKITKSGNNGEFAEERFFYTNGQTTTVEYWQKDSSATLQKIHSIAFEYSGGQLTRSTSTFYNGSPSYYSIYNFSNGNLISVKAYNLTTHALLEEDFYAYDNKINPFHLLTPQYIGNPVSSSKNNVVHYKIVSYKHVPTNPELSFEYGYNDKDYPVKKYIVGASGNRYLDESFSYEPAN